MCQLFIHSQTSRHLFDEIAQQPSLKDVVLQYDGLAQHVGIFLLPIADGQHGEVVALLSILHKLVYGIRHVGNQRLAAVLILQRLQHALQSELSVSSILGFRQSVGIEEQHRS